LRQMRLIGRTDLSNFHPDSREGFTLGSAQAEINAGKRFRFGSNWISFSHVIDEERIVNAMQSLSGMLGFDNLEGKSFLDVGCGSGLFSLAARRLGAKVFSLDFDPESVRCTRQLKAAYASDDAEWSIEEGSALDCDFLASLGQFDVVYSWGVLHHTGAMWR